MGREPLRKECGCGALVWEVSAPGFLPRFTETVICRQCGQDHSRQAPLLWLLRFAWKRLKQRRTVFGLFRMWRQPYPTALFEVRPKQVKHRLKTELAA
mgnify:CR=1 FL=1